MDGLAEEIQKLREEIDRRFREQRAESNVQFLALSQLVLSGFGELKNPAPPIVTHLLYLTERARRLAEESGNVEILEMVDRFADQWGSPKV
jgi:hypothetical protein